MKNKLILEAKIRDGLLNYSDKDFKSKVQRFKSKYEGEKVEVSFEIIDTPQHYQYKYLFGYLYKDVGKAQGERDIYYIDYIMKKEFLFRDVSKFSEIPSKYKKNAMIMPRIDPEWDDRIDGYIIAKRDLNFDEMDEYIKKIEFLLINDLQGNITPNHYRDQLTIIKQNNILGIEVEDPKFSFDKQSEEF